MSKKTSLKKMVTKLNKTKLADSIDTKQDQDDLREDFISTIEELDDENKTDEIPEDVLDFYESLLDEEEPDEEEEEEEPEEEEEEEEEEDDLEDLKRAALKKVIKNEKLEVKVTKKMSDDDVREAIRDARGSEEEEEEEDEGDEFDDMDRKALKAHIKKAKLKIKVTKKMEDDDIREAIRALGEKKSDKKRPGNFTPAGNVPITEACAMAFKKYKGKPTEVKVLSKETNSIRVDAGGKDNVGTAGYYVKFAIKVLQALGYATVKGTKVTVKK